MKRSKEFAIAVGRDLKGIGPGLLIAGIFVGVMLLFFGRICPLVLLTGFPCPGCGLTRAGMLFFSGHLKESIHMHPIFSLIFTFFVIMLIFRYFIKKPFPYFKICVIMISLLMIGGYVYGMLHYFPYREPYVYYQDNYLHKLLSLWRAVR